MVTDIPRKSEKKMVSCIINKSSRVQITNINLLVFILPLLFFVVLFFSTNANAATTDPVFGDAPAVGSMPAVQQYCQDLRSGALGDQNGFIVSVVKCFTDPQSGLFQAVTTNFLNSTQSLYKPMIIAMVTFALSFFGVKLLYNDIQNLKKEAFTLLFKIAVIFYFIDSAPNIYADFLQIMQDLNGTISNAATTVNPNAMCNSSTYINLDGTISTPINTLWGRYDCFFSILFSFKGPSTAVVGISTIIALLFFTAGTGVLIFFAALYMLFAIFFAVVRFLHIYIMAVLSFSFVFCLGYLFVPLMLFHRTMGYFQKWLVICFAYILTPVIIFCYMGMMSVAMDTTLLSGKYSVLKTMFGSSASGDSFADTNCQTNIVYSVGSQSQASFANASCFQQGIANAETGGQADPTHTFSSGCATKSMAADCPYGKYQMKPSTAKYIANNNNQVFDAQQFANNPAYQAQLNEQYVNQLNSSCTKMGVAQADLQSCIAFSYNRGPGAAKNYASTCGTQFASSAFSSCVKATGKVGSVEGANYITKVNNAAGTCTSNGGVIPANNTVMTSNMTSNIIGKLCRDNLKNLFYLSLDNSSGGDTPVDMGTLGKKENNGTGWSDKGLKSYDPNNPSAANMFKPSAYQPAVGIDSKQLDIDALKTQAGASDTSVYLVTLLISICVAALMAYIMLSLISYIPDLASELVSQGTRIGEALVKSEAFGEARIMHTLEMTKDLASALITKSKAGMEKMQQQRK